MQGEIQRQADIIRSLEETNEPPFSSSRQYFSQIDNAPVSPRQLPQDDPRRAGGGSGLAVPGGGSTRLTNNHYRPPVPSNLSISTRRPYGSIGASTTPGPSTPAIPPSPSTLRPQQTPHAGHHLGVHQQQPLPSIHHPGHSLAVEPPPSLSLARRHTSADIRAHGWGGQGSGSSLFGPSGGSSAAAPPIPPLPPSSAQWPPPSPSSRAEDQRIRDSLSSYSLQAATTSSHSRPASPPPPPFTNGNGSSHHHSSSVTNGGDAGGNPFGSWSWSNGNSNKNLTVKAELSAPPTRRGSMAHILNPADTAESSAEDERGDDDRKRKRLG